MRQLTFIKSGLLEWHDVPEPRLEAPRGAMVRPLAVALCDLDPFIIKGETPFPGPFALGHECVARVLSVGEGVATVRVGDLVVVPYQISCGACASCLRGHTGNCQSVPPLSMYGFGQIGGPWGGVLSDVVRVPYADAMLVPLPDGVAPQTVASCGDNIADGWRAVAPTLRSRTDATVLVVGGGYPSIGLYAAAIAVALGAAQVDYLDDNVDRLKRAEAVGAHPIEGPPPDRCGPYSLTVDASVTTEGLACALRSAEPEGVCQSVSIYFTPTTPIPLFDMFRSCITFKTGRGHARPGIPSVLDLVATGRLRPEVITSTTVDWDHAVDALTEGTSSKLVVLRPQ